MSLPIYTVLPFVAWLLTIAFVPLAFPHFWESNRHKAILGFLFSLPIAFIAYSFHLQKEMAHSGLEYFSFIVLLGALFTVSGGVLIKGDIEGTPRNNTIFLIVGGILSNFIGTTGGSMVLIRPFLRINAARKNTAHLPIFFIFMVSNISGCLTPLADPPLFLGYLRGVPFTWNLKLFPIWLTATLVLLTIFYLFDSREYATEEKASIARDQAEIEPITVQGKRNFLLLAGITLSIFLPSPHREFAMILMGFISYKLTNREIHDGNGFSFGPIIEVAVLFAAIFITMVPALIILKTHGNSFGITRPWEFFWLTGSLSSILDNAPTYLTFLSLAQGVTAGNPALPAEIVGIPQIYLKAISVGAVFMGANTYIGNGPNFMVKTIAESSGIKMPSFFGYCKYSFCILVPIYLLVTFLFFR